MTDYKPHETPHPILPLSLSLTHRGIMHLAQRLIASWRCVRRGGYPTSVLWRVRSWTLRPRLSPSVSVFIFGRGPTQEAHTEPMTSCQATRLQKRLSSERWEVSRFKAQSKQLNSPVSVCHTHTHTHRLSDTRTSCPSDMHLSYYACLL